MQEFFCGFGYIYCHIFILYAIFYQNISFSLQYYLMLICVYILFSVHNHFKRIYCEEQKWNI